MILLWTLFFPIAMPAQESKEQILFLMQTGNIKDSFSKYQKLCEHGPQDFKTLQQMALILLKRGAKSQNQEKRKLALYGAGLSASSEGLEILEKGLSSTDAEAQMIALHFLANTQDDKVDELLISAMASQFLPIRMEAAYCLAEKKHPQALGQIQSLMQHLPAQFRPFFPFFFMLLGTKEAMEITKNFLNDYDVDVRVETILNAANFHKDELLPQIRPKLEHGLQQEREAAIFAIGKLKDSASIKQLKTLASSVLPSIRVAALKTLIQLGEISYKEKLEKEALGENLFAINALGQFEGTAKTLRKTFASKNFDVQLNSAIALLKNKDPHCLNLIARILIKRDGFLPLSIAFSPGKTLPFFKLAKSRSLKAEEGEMEISLAIREQILQDCIELDETHFLKIAKLICENDQNDLIPHLIDLLENLQTDSTIAFLKQEAQKPGSPLIRDYCNLALFRLKEPGPYENYLYSWVEQNHNNDIIRLKSVSNPKFFTSTNHYELTLPEKSRLLIDIYSALFSTREEKNIKAVIEAIKNTKPKNRYALSGLLLQATE